MRGDALEQAACYEEDTHDLGQGSRPFTGVICSSLHAGYVNERMPKTLCSRFHVNEQDPANSWVEAEVDGASIETHHVLRDAHLRSCAFFAVKQYPEVIFQRTSRQQRT